MKLYLIRHARAVPRSEWTGHDELRPLSLRGRDEAALLVDSLREDPPRQLISGPALRCQQTLEPLGVLHGVPLEVDDRLAQGETAARTLELLPTLGPGPVALCTHADVIDALLAALELRAHVEDGATCCRKGAYWVLDGGASYTPARAEYVEPSGRPRRRDAAPSRGPRSVRAAALDLGSTSFNLLIADVGRGGRVTPVIREKMMLQLGGVIANGGRIPKDVSRRAAETARELADLAEREKVQHMIPVATAALREASNGRKVADAIGKALGTPIRILSGEEEARIVFLALHRRLNLGDAPVLGLDLGGGSLEIVAGRDGAADYWASLPLGAVRLRAELVRDDPMRDEEVAAIRARVAACLAPHREAFLTRGSVRAVAAGGAARALARVADERRGRRHSEPEPAPHLPRAELRELQQELVASSREQRLRMRGMRKRRADVLPTAAVVLNTVAEQLGLDAYTVCDWGLREGLLLDALER